MSTRFDIIIIGSGAGSGTLALKLAAPGKRILTCSLRVAEHLFKRLR
jgi:choline dehydrogenase-like flavoprotein